MAEAVPQHVEGVTYLSRVPGELQLKELENNRERIHQFLHRTLRNSFVTINYELIPEEDRPKIAFSPREKMQEMIDENPAVDELVKAFKLEIG